MKMTINEVCENWEISKQDNMEKFDWVLADKLDDQGRITRELGILKQGDEPLKLKRIYNNFNDLAGFYDIETGERFKGNVSVNLKDIKRG